MSDTVTQSLGFDASSAIAALSQLDSALATFEGRLQQSAIGLRAFNASGTQTASLLTRLAKNADTAAQALGRLSSNSSGNIQGFAAAYNNLGTTVAATANTITTQNAQITSNTAATAAATASNLTKMTTSFQLLSRIVFTQAIVRALSTLRNALRDVGGEAVQFQNKIALVRTIDDSGRSFNQLSNSVRSVSDSLNIPLLQTAAGLYQTISNQVGDATQSLQFLTEAGKFAKATDSNLQDSVDLLSGAMKSFGLGVDDTGRVASTFFKTIDLGRITADQLANSFGRVGPQAGALGLSLEEVGASIAAISVQGSNSNEALTQFRGILTALVKPTEAMKATLKDAGFTSAEFAIKAVGLTGVLRTLATATDGSDEAMAKLFPNVRGLNGALALTSANLKTLVDNLDEMESASSQTSNNKFLEATATDAQTVTKEINKLKNALTFDLGQAFLKFGADMSNAVGGVDTFVNLIKASPPAVASLTASLITFTAAAKLAGATGAAFGASFALPLIAVGIGKSLGSFIDDKIFEANFAKLNDLIGSDKEQLDQLRESSKSVLEEAKSGDDERVKSAREASIEISKSYIEATDEAIAQNKRLIKDLKSDAADVTGAYGKLSTAISQAIADAERSKQTSANRIQGLQNEQAKADLSSQLAGLNDAQKVFALSQQALQFANQAASLIRSSSGNDALATRGRQLADLAKQLLEEESSLAQKTGNNSLVAKAAGDLRGFYQAQVNAESALAKADDDRISKLQQQGSLVKSVGSQLKEQLAILLENTGALDKNGKQLSDNELKQRQAARDAANQQIEKLVSQINPADLKNLGLGDAVAKLQSTLTRAPIQLALDATASTSQVQNQLTQAFASFKVKLQVETGLDTNALEQVVGQQFKSSEQLFQGLDKAAAEAADLRKTLSQFSQANVASAQIRNQIAEARDVALNSKPSVNSLGFSQNADAQLDSLLFTFTNLANKVNVTAADIQLASARVKEFQDNTKGLIDTRLAYNTVNDAIGVMLVRLEALSQEQKGTLDGSQVQGMIERLKVLDGLLGSLKVGNIGEQLQSGANALQTATGPSEVIATDAARAAASLEQGARAWIDASKASFQTPGGGGVQGLANGGLVRYYADGGFTPRGTDTIPAMLSPGEFVVNAAATRQFYAQLVAINSGRQPIYRAEGGPTVQNFNFGDVNLLSDGQRNTARDFVKGVRRELRRTTSQL